MTKTKRVTPRRAKQRDTVLLNSEQTRVEISDAIEVKAIGAA